MNPFDTKVTAIDVLKKYWGYPSFRKGQQEAIESVLNGTDTVVLFPTGAGKSLCYQVPALVFNGLTVVISPLIALMQDQVEQLTNAGINATFINSTISSREVEQRLINARNGMYKLLYISPERVATDLWKREQPNLDISLIAVDEAHCISEWGHEFRPAYRHLKEEFGDLPDQVVWIALTATATPEVKNDIIETLEFETPSIITSGFERENLFWWVVHTEQKRKHVLKSVMRASRLGSGIVYASTRKECEQLSSVFTANNLSCKPYHAGVSNEDRSKIQQDWISGELPLVTATNAFGMGIDKADCRYVIHQTVPFSLEAYYQEAGRAGRDGNSAYPVLVYKSSDIDVLSKRIEQSYPDYTILQRVYNALCDELNLAVGSEQQGYESIPFDHVTRRSGVSLSKVRMALNLLQRLNILHLSILREPRVGVQFMVTNNFLIDFIDKQKPGKGEFIDTLMRCLGPESLHKKFFIDESILLEKLNINSHQLFKGLHVLANHDQILTFSQDNELTLVKLDEPRIKTLQIDRKDAYHYKEILLEKLQYVKRYAETSECREVFLRTYFGETDCDSCGRCDNCKEKERKSKEITKEDVIEAEKAFRESEYTTKELATQLKWNQDKTKRVLSFMVRENKVDYIETESGGKFCISER